VGDWNGNGTAGVGLRRGRTWFLKNRLDASTHEIQFDWARPEDIPITADWDGTGRTGIGMVRGNRWYLKTRLDASSHDRELTFGDPGDTFIGWDQSR
jgi:lactocepin